MPIPPNQIFFFGLFFVLFSCEQDQKTDHKTIPIQDSTVLSKSTLIDCDEPYGIPLDSLNNFTLAFNNTDSIPATVILQMDRIFMRRKKSIQSLSIWQKWLNLPMSGRIIEMTPIKDCPNRSILLFMNQPKVFASPGVYWCGVSVYGDTYITGDAQIMLIDTQNKQIINVLTYPEIVNTDFGYCLHIPLFYLDILDNDNNIKSLEILSQGQPLSVLKLADLNGDGIAGDFIASEYLSCGNEIDMIVGYNPLIDRLVRYEFDLTITDKTGSGIDSIYQETQFWIPNLKRDQNIEKGVIEIYHDYAHGSETGFIYKMKYHPEKGKFEGSLDLVPITDMQSY